MLKWIARLRRSDSEPRGFLGRLRRDIRGNTLAIVGAALVPLTAMIGSGVDMSRAYMAKTRLQSACDAGSLAARRVMQNDTLTQPVIDEGRRFFNFNFNPGLYGTAAFTPTVTRPAAGTVRMTASTTIPTTIMGMFGFTSLPLDVTCDASLNFVNTDVMLVLDVTGSMLQDINGNNTSTVANQKITALRDAVMALYDELAPIQTQLEANSLRLRYGVVPYSSSVNVGALIRGVNVDYLTASTPYQSRTANYTTTTTQSVDTAITAFEAGLLATPGVQRFQTSGTDRAISNSNCANFGNNTGFTQSGWTYTSIGPNGDADVYDPDGAAGPQANAPASPTGYVRYQFSRNTPSWSGTPNDRVCDRNVTITRRSYTTRYSYTDDSFRVATYDTSQFRQGNAVTIANPANNNNTSDFTGTLPVSTTLSSMQALVNPANGGTGIGTTTSTWNGCIEERATTSTITGSSTNVIPNSAFDLDINRIPNNDNTRWRPMWPEITYRRTAGSTTATSGTQMSNEDDAYWACPTAAQRLQAWTRANLLSYVNGLTPIGGTYHDIGMIWGARMISSGGVFADSPDAFNSMPVARHIIFMTDGQLAPNCNTYTSYGIEQNDQRVTGSSSCADQYNRHLKRFNMVCDAAKSLNASIWVIAFGTSLSTDMANCASNANQASTIGSRDALIARFREIGSNIGALRLTQ